MIKSLEKQFRVKDLGELRLVLGMECELIEETMKMTQVTKIMKSVKCMGLEGVKPTPTPYNPSIKIGVNEGESIDPVEYQSIIGSLWYIARCTRPDIMFIVSLLAQHQKNPSQEHWGAIKHLVRYLSGTPNCGIVLGVKGESNELIIAADSSFADVQQSLYLTTGFCGLIGKNIIAWMLLEPISWIL